MCFRRQFLCKMWPNHLTLFRFIICRMFLSFWLYVILPYFTHDWYSWCSAWEFCVFIKLQIHSFCTSFSGQPYFDMRSSDALIGTVSMDQLPTKTSNFNCSPLEWSTLRDPRPCHI
jgi:hypothetical protein